MKIIRPLRAAACPGRPLGDAVRAGEVGVDDALERLLAHPQQQRVVGDAGVGDQHLDRPELGLDRAERGVDLLGRRDVALTPNRPSGAPLPRWVTATRSPLAANACAIASPMPAVAAGDEHDRPSRLGHVPDASGSPAGLSRAALPARTVGGMRAIQLTEFGGPETLVVSEMPDPMPGDGQQVVRRARGRHQLRRHPPDRGLLPGPADAADDPRRRGRRARPGRPPAARAAGGAGGYAEKVAADPRRLFPVPDAVSDGAALTTLVQGATAWHLLRTSAHLQRGRDGRRARRRRRRRARIAIQLAKRWGAGRVIATASSEEKRALTLDLGADVAVDSRADDLTARTARGQRRQAASTSCSR